MAPLQGLTGLYADPQDTTDVFDEGVLEAKANALDPDHSDYGSQYLGYSGTVPAAVPFAGQEVYDGYDPAMVNQFGGMSYPVAGFPLDSTPETHVSPYPRGIIQPSWGDPDAYARAGLQMQDLHNLDMGGPRLFNGHAPPGHEEVTHYTTDDYVAPNENYLSADVPGQLKGGRGNSAGGYGAGNADPTQGYGVLNTMEEFNAGHSIRRVQHDSVHFDYTNTHGEQSVPFYGRHPVEQMPLDGPDSPYYEQGSIDGANIVWEGRIGDPTPYVQPAEPTIAAAVPSSDVWAWT
jgi:hypothetical protein